MAVKQLAKESTNDPKFEGSIPATPGFK